MVDDELDRDERIYPRGLAPESSDRVAHRREVDDRRHPGQVLHEDTLGAEPDLAGSATALRRLAAAATASMSEAGHSMPSSCRKKVLQEDLQAVRQPLDLETPGERVEPVDIEVAAADGDGRP